jgi:phosphohistidine swiveling domain-containing protein
VEPPPDPGISWSRELTAERYPLPLSPLGWTNLKAVFDQGVRRFARFMNLPIEAHENLATCDRGWILANADAFDFRNRFRVRPRAAEWLPVLAGVGRALPCSSRLPGELLRLIRFVLDPGKARTRLGDELNGATLPLAGGAALAFLRRVAGEVEASWPSTLSRFRSETARIDQLVGTASGWRELLDLGDRLRQETILYVAPDLVIFAIKQIASELLVDLAKLASVERPIELVAELGRGLDSNVTLEFHDRLHQLGVLLREKGYPESPVPDEVRPRVDDFLATFGHVTSSWDILEPSWGERPEAFLRLAVDSGKTAPPDRRSSSNDTMERELLDRLASNPFAKRLARELVAILRRFMVVDEEHHFHCGRVIPVTRRIVLRLGGILVERGILDEPGDIFWLTDPEVRSTLADGSAGSRRTLVRLRRIVHDRSLKSGPPVGSRDTLAAKVTGSSGSVMVGIGVSRGAAIGPVRRAMDLADLERVTPGDVLVTRSPDPALTVVFPRLSAFVSEAGALLSHGAVAAREYRLPAVFGVKNAWKNLENGTMVEVDGGRGTVTLVDTDEASGRDR